MLRAGAIRGRRCDANRGKTFSPKRGLKLGGQKIAIRSGQQDRARAPVPVRTADRMSAPALRGGEKPRGFQKGEQRTPEGRKQPFAGRVAEQVCGSRKGRRLHLIGRQANPGRGDRSGPRRGHLACEVRTFQPVYLFSGRAPACRNPLRLGGIRPQTEKDERAGSWPVGTDPVGTGHKRAGAKGARPAKLVKHTQTHGPRARRRTTGRIRRFHEPSPPRNPASPYWRSAFF